MSLRTHSDQKYCTTESSGGVTEWDALRVEHRQIAAGAQNGLTSECTEFVYILSGKAKVRRTGDGQRQEGIARPGTSWLVPAGTHETLLELDDASECLHVFLPATLLDRSALADYDIDPDRIQLAYVGGFVDPTLARIGAALHGLLRCDASTTDRIVADGMRTALAGHLIGNYSVDRLRPATRSASLDEKRLKRVVDFVEARLADDISLDDLAAEACLSAFHFLRLFRDATGLSPHRYLTSRRIKAAQAMLACRHASLVQVALDVGFSSQGSFTRVFRKWTGMTPGQYRKLYAR